MSRHLLEMGGAELEARDEDGMTALLRACYKGHIRAAQTLIERGADVYAVDKVRSGSQSDAMGARIL